MRASDKYSLIASCGMNCTVCMAYLREKNRCPGCRAFNSAEPVSIARCKIRNCELIKTNRIKYCFECNDYPCASVKHLDKRYRTRYGMSMIENLGTIKEKGIREFIKHETIRWACSNCSGTICVHKGYCSKCGTKRKAAEIKAKT
jgi:hypothetical protein